MARQPVVSRTIKTFICNCLVYDKNGGENIKIKVHLNRKYTDNKMLISACKKHIPDKYIFITVLSGPTLKEQKMFLTLDEFIELAHPVIDEPVNNKEKEKEINNNDSKNSKRRNGSK